MINMLLAPFLVSFFIAIFLLYFILKVSSKLKINDIRTSARHIHQSNIPRFGGVAMILSFMAAIFMDSNLVISPQLWGALFAILLILVYGVSDDILQLDWKIQLFFQFLISCLVFAVGIRLEYISNPLGGIISFDGSFGLVINFLIVTVWLIFIMNAMNWVDGIDGVSGGISIIGSIAILIVSLRPEVNQPPVAIIAMALIGSILAFIVFNYNPARVLAGTSGSIFMGFILSILAIFSGAKIATTLLVLAVPVIDAIWVVSERVRSGRSIFTADKSHLHYRLIEIGWSQKRICIFYWLLTALIAIAALNFDAVGKIILFAAIIIVMVCLYFYINRIALRKTF